MGYIGRFAPSPTGPLHFGSLVAALASYLDARHHQGTWLLRIEDLDPPRESPSAPREITGQLRAFGLDWDGEVLYQSTRHDAYEQALASLERLHLTYRCSCSRKSSTRVYPGSCRHAEGKEASRPFAIRLRGSDPVVVFEDRIFGRIKANRDADIGDFVIRRKDSLFAYQLAVVVDDDHQQVNQVVRGADLLQSTPKQLAIYKALDLPPPDYLHLPVVTDAAGAKLGKQSRSPAVSTTDILGQMKRALALLGQPAQPGATTAAQLLAAAIQCWRTESIPRQETLSL